MDATVAEPIRPAVRYPEMSIEERVIAIEGTITNQDRIFDMLHEGQQNRINNIAGLRDETHASFREMRCDMDKRFGEVDARINETNERIAAMGGFAWTQPLTGWCVGAGTSMQRIRQKSSPHLVQLPLELAEVVHRCCDLDQFVQQCTVSFAEVVYALGHPSRN